MARLIQTQDIERDLAAGLFDPTTIHHIYNGLDTLLTNEINESLDADISQDPYAQIIYPFEQALLEPAILMGRHGFRVDMAARAAGMADYKSRLLAFAGMGRGADDKWYISNQEAPLQRLALAVTGRTLNINSTPQLQDLFYDKLALPPVWKRKKGVKSLSCDREALEKLADKYPRAIPLAYCILKARDLQGTLEMLERGVDRDGRMRYGLNVAGTENGRWSSNKDPFRMGGNVQNLPPDVKHIVLPDEGCVLFYIDLKTAESRLVAYLSGDEAYIEACEGADLHTTVASMVWPNAVNDRASADAPYYRTFSYRDLAKRGSHLSNYGGKAWTMARHLKIEVAVAEAFQELYFQRFPGIPKWHNNVIQELQTTECIITPLGRRRHFWSRTNDDSTIREAIAFSPQGTIADIMNYGLLRIWTELYSEGVRPHIQCHDAVVGSMPIGRANELMPRILDCLENPVMIGGRKMIIPGDPKWGPNWKAQEKWKPT